MEDLIIFHPSTVSLLNICLISVSSPPIPKPVPECYSDDECSYDKACLNERCINPCLRDRPCGIGAFCSVNNHKAVCTCPIGFEGSPHTECLPRKFNRKSAFV